VVEEAAGGGDEDVDTSSECIALGTVTDAAVDESGAQLGEAAELEEVVVGLLGEFAGGFEDEAAGAWSMGSEAAEDRQGEGGGLAVPVCAEPMMSRPSRMSGMALAWMGVGST
jgi:hypothetical protein